MGDDELPGYRVAIQAKYESHYASTDPERERAVRDACAPYLARVLARLDAPDAGWALDVGCGSGLASLALAAQKPGLHVVGLDASPSALDLARRAARDGRHDHAKFVEGQAEDPPSGPFDRIVSVCAFNLLADKREALRAWRAVARARARLVVADAFAAPDARLAGAGPLSQEAFGTLARSCGWRVTGIEDATWLVRAVHARGLWDWPEYVESGVAHCIVALDAMRS